MSWQITYNVLTDNLRCPDRYSLWLPVWLPSSSPCWSGWWRYLSGQLSGLATSPTAARHRQCTPHTGLPSWDASSLYQGLPQPSNNGNLLLQFTLHIFFNIMAICCCCSSLYISFLIQTVQTISILGIFKLVITLIIFSKLFKIFWNLN